MLLSDPLKFFFCFTVQAHTVYTCRSPLSLHCPYSLVSERERNIHFSSLIALMVSLHIYFKIVAFVTYRSLLR